VAGYKGVVSNGLRIPPFATAITFASEINVAGESHALAPLNTKKPLFGISLDTSVFLATPYNRSLKILGESLYSHPLWSQFRSVPRLLIVVCRDSTREYR
jgi:hypothetical protein